MDSVNTALLTCLCTGQGGLDFVVGGIWCLLESLLTCLRGQGDRGAH